MSTQIQGTKFIYEIDTQDYPDGFIASGTESYVFKGRKIAIGENGRPDLSFSCVLKFKPKSKERLDRFKEQELKIFEELQECRSVARIYDVVEDLGDSFELKVPGMDICIRNSKNGDSANELPCFCVVEEFIDGWSLEQYCRRQFWGLEKLKDNRWINFHKFDQSEQDEVLKKYKDEKTFFRYQDKLLRFMQSLCGILMFISSTSKRKVLHLDIKPENIMVTRQSEELVLIDFGRSVFLPEGEQFVYHKLAEVDYAKWETLEEQFSHGTIGYAAPECFAQPVPGADFPFAEEGYNIGRMSIESDIFSFGATFWECMNIVELVTRSSLFADSPHDFYEKNLLNEQAYFNRDLSLECTGPLGGRYHSSLQKIVRKCTGQRRVGYLDSPKFYHNYDELKQDLDEARDSIPTVKKGENKRIQNASLIFGLCIGCIISLFLCSSVYRAVGANIARDNWIKLVNDIQLHGNDSAYQTTKEAKIAQISLERMELADNSQKRKDICRETYTFLSRDKVINTYEASMIISLLEFLDNDEDKIEYVDKIMENAYTVEISSICSNIRSMGINSDDLGYEVP